jgi:hypothetical protein
MQYASALALVCLAAISLVAGILASAPAAFVLAALAAAGAVLLLARRNRTKRVQTFVRQPPPRVDPKWSLDDSLRELRDEQIPVELEIDHVIDGYRDLVAAEVLPSLETLSVEELRKVINVERHGRNRQAIIHRAEVLIDLTEKPIEVRDAVIDPAAPRTPRRPSVSAAKKASKSAEREPRNTLKKSGPDLTL